MNNEQRALVAIGAYLAEANYQFVTITPESHRLVNDRLGNQFARDLRDVFGWSRRFTAAAIPEPILRALDAAGALAREDGAFRSRVRFSRLGGDLFCHSAYPTREQDAVFFGPDTYRFAAWLRRVVAPCERLVDVGCGSGAGAIALADRARRLIFADINPRALALATVNAKLAGLGEERVELALGDLYQSIAGSIDAIIANPPYLIDADARVYRDGGGAWGTALAVRIVREGLARLAPGGRLYLYTGVPIRAGRNLLLDELAPVLAEAAAWQLDELDPDVFGEELAREPYASGDIERIAAIGLHLQTR